VLIRQYRWPAGALALFTALTVVHLWPMAAAPGVWSRNDAPDYVLHEWIMAWVAHQVVVDPLHLFDANIFYPDRYTLAYSDHLILQSLMGAPLAWIGASPVLVHNLVLMAGFVLTGWATALVVAAWTGNRTAGALSGSLLAFNSFTLTRLAQMQDLHLEFFAPALFALDRFIVTAQTRDALKLAGWFVLQALTGTYVMLFTAISLVVAAAARAGEFAGRRFGPVASRALLAAAVATVVLTPVLIPYVLASREVGLSRSLQETAEYAAEWTDYLAAAGRLHFGWWSGRFFKGDALFPGVVALLLMVVALAAGTAFTDRRARMVLAIGLAALTLSFGPSLPFYDWLYWLFPPLTLIRGVVRFGQIVLAAVAILAGFGLAWVMTRFRGRAVAVVAILLVIAANGEALRAPFGYTRYEGISRLYDVLRTTGDDTVVVSMPFYPTASFHYNTAFMLGSTRFWKPIVNGYSGFKPPSLYANVEQLRGFPDDRSMARLGELGVTHVVVDARHMQEADVNRVAEYTQLRLMFTDGWLRLYSLSKRAP
jgi:hypothetical protein